MKPFRVTIAAAGLLILTGCVATSVGSYQSFGTFNSVLSSELAVRSREYEGIERNPVVIIPGFLGSKLTDIATGEMVWGEFSTSTFSEDNLRALALPMQIGQVLSGLKSSSLPFGILDDAEIRFAGLTFSQPGYITAVEQLEAAGYVNGDKPLPPNRKHPNLFCFAYDWRRDLPESAAKLHEFLIEKRKYLQGIYEKEYGVKDYDVQFDIVAHSMGGLLARYYLMYGKQDLPEKPGELPNLDWSGAKIVDKLIVVGTPNDGYLDTFRELVQGLALVPGAPRLPAGILSTFPSYYQMLPGASGGNVAYKLKDGKRIMYYNLFNPNAWSQNKWGLCDPENDRYWQLAIPEGGTFTPEQRLKIARDHLIKCLIRADQFRRALTVAASVPDDCVLYLFAGDAVKTASTIYVDVNGELLDTEYSSGDGKILISSARFDSTTREIKMPPRSRSPIAWQAIYHVKAAHMGLFVSDDFWHNVRYNLLMQPMPKSGVNYKTKQ
ncbi:MAG: hypothetical protein LBM70_01320 [Victivallales bacterium]|jgi:pimeloyl-ACP methyl ester carboxylesterase|nr:hypothetical protein [Victivallales bacterium]